MLNHMAEYSVVLVLCLLLGDSMDYWTMESVS